jgi:hypothetical protein
MSQTWQKPPEISRSMRDFPSFLNLEDGRGVANTTPRQPYEDD